MSDAEAGTPPDTVVGGPAVSVRGLLLVALFWIDYVSWIVASGNYSALATSAVLFMPTAWMLWRPLTVVDARGVWAAHRVRRGLTLTWAQVEAVVDPRSHDNQVDLFMTDGSIRGLALIAATDAVSVACIGGKQLRPRPPPSSVPTPPSQLEQDRALSVRAQRLAVERDHLRTQLARRGHIA